MFSPIRVSLLLGLLLLSIENSSAQEGRAGDWVFATARPVLAPQHWREVKVKIDGQPTLALAGGGKAHADGRWARVVAVEGKQHYSFQAQYRVEKVDEPQRSVLARVVWMSAAGEDIGTPEYPRAGGAQRKGLMLLHGVYQAPAEASRARLELVYRWDADGRVFFSEGTLRQIAPPAPRVVGLGAVRYRPPSGSLLSTNLVRYGELIGRAVDLRADIVTLPEAINMAGTGRNYAEAAEAIPGPTTQYLGSVARRYGVYIVAGLIEKAGEIIYNTAVLIDPQGNVAGRYRKVSLPREEIDGGITPGDSFPVFDTPFGRMGMMICWDVSFPEPAATLARQGAEVILMPIWGGITDLARARAIENQVYLVSASFDMETAIFGRDGKMLAEATDAQPVAVWQVDLSQPKIWEWLGDFGSRIQRERPPRRSWR